MEFTMTHSKARDKKTGEDLNIIVIAKHRRSPTGTGRLCVWKLDEITRCVQQLSQKKLSHRGNAGQSPKLEDPGMLDWDEVLIPKTVTADPDSSAAEEDESKIAQGGRETMIDLAK